MICFYMLGLFAPPYDPPARLDGLQVLVREIGWAVSYLLFSEWGLLVLFAGFVLVVFARVYLSRGQSGRK